MIRWNTVTVHACVASAIIALPLLAQKQDKQDKQAAAGASSCSVKTDKPDEVKSALNAITVAQLGGRPEDQQKRLKIAVAALTQNPSKYKDNQAGHDYVLGQALVRWAQQFPESTTVNKGTMGYTDGKDQSIDPLATADTLFSSVEKSNPDCAADVASLRMEAMRPLAIRASALLNADSVAQAEAVINRLKMIDNKSPLSLYFQAMVAQNKKDVTSAADLFSRGAAAMPAAAGPDSNLKAALELGAAQMTRLSAQSMTGDQKKAGMLKAADLYRKFLADFPKSANAPDAQAGLAASLSASGDPQSVGKLWDDMLATPANYTAAQLYDAGTQAFTANQFGPAVKLMDAAQVKNGWLRPGLYNSANVYWKAGDFDRMLATAKKLTQIDPNNPDEYQLLALAYQGKAKATKDPKLVRAYNDSLNAAFAASEKVKVKVTFDAFAMGSAKPTLSGTLENLSDAPQKGTLKVTFLNEAGAPVTTGTTDFTLAPKEKKPFSVTGQGAGIVAYKYDPIP
jgi:tetratricopeptide (TPR) repeat protein